MAKKKGNRSKHQKDLSFGDTSEEEYGAVNIQGNSCLHVARGIHFGRVKKSLKSSQSIRTCSGCQPVENADDEVWLCLQCGHRGCGRTSENQHGLQHFKTLHSDCHALVLSTTSSAVWCYDCDAEVNLQSSRVLRQCVEFVMKMASTGKPPGSNSSEASQKLTIREEPAVLKNEEPVVEKCKKQPVKSTKETAAKIAIKGLRNLGNTCFFNAVMQNLNQTGLLYHELKNTCNPSKPWEVPEMEGPETNKLELSLPRPLPMTNSLLNFLEQMSPSSSSAVVNPSSLFSEISKKCPQFRHFQQQDSHELLRQLLDGVRQEEIKRQKKAILRHFDLENITPDEVDEETKKMIKAYGCFASHTIVEKIFGGQLISTVLCEECKTSSQVFEPFMDLSLPLFEEKHQECNEQLNAMLDGGKQDRIKPLRNRKTECDEGEYVLPRPRNDAGRPSKHQEKKQKQLAKKEKKRAKNTARNRKNSLNEHSDNAADNQQPEACEEENDREIEEENWELTALLEPEEEQGHGKSSNFPIKEEEPACENILQNPSEIVSQNGDVTRTHDKVVDDVESAQSASVAQDDLRVEKVPDCTLDATLEENPELVKCVELDHLVSEESVVPNDSQTDVCSGNPSAMSVTENEGNKALVEKSACHSINQEDAQGEQSLSNEELRIHALTLQIRDVRIRRDSDNVLTSSDCEDHTTTPKSSFEDTCSMDSNFSKDWISRTLNTLQPRPPANPLECSIISCLSHFTKPELLTGNNKFRCDNCTELKSTGNKKEIVYSNASKQLLIFSAPAILTLHLKRFQQVGMSLRKVNRWVEFPLVLDLAPFCCSACTSLPHMSGVRDEVLYSLYGVVEHSGRLTSGHYTAYVKSNRRNVNEAFECHLPVSQCDLHRLQQHEGVPHQESLKCSKDDVWYYVSDNHVREASEAQVLRCQAYLLFYERIK